MPEELHSVVVPVYNEETVINSFYERATQALGVLPGFEIIFVDDGSTDTTTERIRQLASTDARVRLVRLSRNFGQQLALTAGIDAATGDTVTVIDCDLQDPPELIPDMVKLWREGADVVFAVRERRHGESWHKRATAKLFYRTMHMLTSVDIPMDHSEFRLVSRRAANELRAMREQHRYTRGMVSWLGMNRSFIRYDRQPREAGETKYSYAKLIRVAADGIVSFSIRPLQFATYLGFLAAGFSAAYGVFVLLHWLLTRESVEGWTSLVIVVLFLGGVQLLTLGVIGEYIGRIYDDVRARPLYVVDDMVGFPPSSKPASGETE
jgi:dolichol-phosphate mannosyltransferase